MTSPLGAADFFTLEAGDCLDRLEVLTTRPEGPATDEFVRLARAFRGSALMANHHAIAQAAAGLEGLARAVREGRRSWDAGVREQLGQSVDEFRQLVRQARTWTDADTARALRLGTTFDGLAGRVTSAAARAAENTDLHTGVRAFVAREGALIASALDRAARSLRSTPENREPLYAVLRRMQSLRGLAELGELSPLPEILDGVELAVGDLTRLFAPPPGVDAVLDAAAQALSRVCRDVAELGRPARDADEARRFTDLLLRAFAAEHDVVPIESLFIDGDAEPLRRSGAHPQFSPPEALGALELVSHGEHLRQAADGVEGAGSAVERDLRLYGLVPVLRSIHGAGGGPVAVALASFALASRDRIADGSAAGDSAGFAVLLRRVGDLARSSADARDAGAIAGDIARCAAEMAPTRAADAADAGPIVPVESLAYDLPVVPIESLAYDGEPVPAASPAAASPAADESALERTFRTYARLLATQPAGEPSLARLASAPAPAAAAVATTPSATAAAAEAKEVPDETADVVEIGALCFRGRRALERADEVGAALRLRLSVGSELGSVRPLLDELLDLVPLALDDA
jgi:chemotaxis protein histidine kinase CheA